MSRLQRLLDAGLEAEIQAAVAALARGEDVALSPGAEQLVVQVLRGSGQYASVERDPRTVGLRRLDRSVR